MPYQNLLENIYKCIIHGMLNLCIYVQGEREGKKLNWESGGERGSEDHVVIIN